MKDINLLKSNGINVDEAIELLGDTEMYEETLSDFVEESKERNKKMEEYMKNRDMANYAILVHALKSDSKYLGFTKLADMAFEHQMKSQENNINYVRDHYKELMDEDERILKLVSEYLKS